MASQLVRVLIIRQPDDLDPGNAVPDQRFADRLRANLSATGRCYEINLGVPARQLAWGEQAIWARSRMTSMDRVGPPPTGCPRAALAR